MDPNDGRVVSNFIVQVIKGEPITNLWRGEQTRIFYYVDDLVDGMICLMKKSALRAPATWEIRRNLPC